MYLREKDTFKGDFIHMKSSPPQKSPVRQAQLAVPVYRAQKQYHSPTDAAREQSRGVWGGRTDHPRSLRWYSAPSSVSPMSDSSWFSG